MWGGLFQDRSISMILFEDDWENYPTAIVDVNTKNRSFVRLAGVLKKMGISNHYFFLALINPELQGIDPHDPNISPADAAAVAIECSINPWYFFREAARAPGDAGDGDSPMEANRANISLFWCFFNHIFYILIQPRQTGKSFSTDILMRVLLNCICTDTKINLLTKDNELRRKNIERLKAINDALPKYLQMRSPDDANNGEEITVRKLGNFYNTHVPQASTKRAYSMGRGLTTAIMHIDEGPFQPNISISLPAALAATGASVERAKKAGAPYGTIMTTTAGKKDDKDGRYVYTIMSEAAIWDEVFYDALDVAALEKLVRNASPARKFRIVGSFSHSQLGKSDEWLRTKLEESLQTGDDANRDYFNIWTSGTESSPFTPIVADMIARGKRDVQFTEISGDSYIIRWYVPEEQLATRMTEGHYVMAMDTSDASGGDDISMLIMDTRNMEVVGAGQYNETNLIVFAKWVCGLLLRFKNMTAIIERRSTGAMILDYLLHMLPIAGEDPFKRLFNRVVQDYDEDPSRYREIQVPPGRRPSDINVRLKKTFGFATSGSGTYSRSDLYGNTLQLAVKRCGERIYDHRTINQILGLVIRNGRVDHEAGEHDDMVIGWLLGVWFMTQGKNLAHYGVDTNQLMSDVQGRKQTVSFEEQVIRSQQIKIRERMEALYEELTNERDEWVAMRIEQDLRRLDKRLVLEEGEIFSLDELIRKAKETKRAKRRNAVSLSAVNDSSYATQSGGVAMAQASSYSNKPVGSYSGYNRGRAA